MSFPPKDNSRSFKDEDLSQLPFSQRIDYLPFDCGKVVWDHNVILAPFLDCTYAWVATYSCTDKLPPFIYPKVARLLVGLPNPPDRFKGEVRYSSNLHCKLYLYFRGSARDPYIAFVGSHNLVKGTQINCSVQLDNHKQLSHLRDTFVEMWDSLDCYYK